jgi:purine-cytosine permease-like protein
MTRIIKNKYKNYLTKISASVLPLHLKLELILIWLLTIIGLIIIFMFDISFNFKGTTSPWSIIISFWIILLIISIIRYLINIIHFFLIRKYYKDFRIKYNLKDPKDQKDQNDPNDLG